MQKHLIFSATAASYWPLSLATTQLVSRCHLPFQWAEQPNGWPLGSQGQVGFPRAKAETKVAEEQAAAIARALQEDEAHRRADLEEVAEEEAEAVPWSRQPAPGGGIKAAPDRRDRHAG